MADDATPAEVIEVIGRTGVKGEINQVMAKILDGREKGNIKRRNIKGPIQKGDILLLIEVETEAKAINPR